MKSVTQLKAWRDQMKLIIATKMQPEKNRFLAEKARIEADGTRHRDYIKEKVDEVRDKTLSTFGLPIAEVRHLERVVAAETMAWRSISFVLSHARFDKNDAAAENGTRQRWYNELSSMPPGLFALTVADLKRSENHAGLYQAYLVGCKKSGEPGWKGVDLSNMVLPEQREALDVILECSTLPAQAENVVGEVSGRIVANPLANARALQPTPLQPTLDFDDMPEPATRVHASSISADATVAAEELSGDPAGRLNRHRGVVAA